MNTKLNELIISRVERGLLPDILVRAGIRRLLKQRLREIGVGDAAKTAALRREFIDTLRHSPVALLPQKANEQHYEVPAEFFGAVLGQHRKYSCCYWPDGIADLDGAEAAALQVTCERAGLANHQDILELGCGWGSLSLWMATHYPDAHITAVSNSHSQRQYIEDQARERGIANLQVITCDMNEFDSTQRFDRIVSVEMFEHMRNWPELFRRVSTWLQPDGRFFMHVFVHRSTPYEFIERDASDWMSRHFFAGGMMPSDDLPEQFQEHLQLLEHWRWDGHHYERTCNAWLQNMDSQRAQLWPLFESTYGSVAARQWWERWRIFFMSCAELFGYDNASEWWVSHYLLERRP
ncbi:MAG: cyclopropane-fatty-acyl-phospholipid synthase family protein [Spongiibacteraceae bacterium]